MPLRNRKTNGTYDSKIETWRFNSEISLLLLKIKKRYNNFLPSMNKERARWGRIEQRTLSLDITKYP
jgi:hypothetical protein